jgi:hypothetical protein
VLYYSTIFVLTTPSPAPKKEEGEEEKERMKVLALKVKLCYFVNRVSDVASSMMCYKKGFQKLR